MASGLSDFIPGPCDIAALHPKASPLVARLSHALFNDPPSITLRKQQQQRLRNCPADSSHRPREAARNPNGTGVDASNAAEVYNRVNIRLSLPESFAVAERAYHAESSDSPFVEAHRRRLRRLRNSTLIHSKSTEDEDSGGAAVPSHDEQHLPTSCSQAQSPTMTQQKDSLMVVVESVLGFSALQALLETACLSREDELVAARDSDRTEAESSCQAGDKRSRARRTDVGALAAIGRLAGWLHAIAVFLYDSTTGERQREQQLSSRRGDSGPSASGKASDKGLGGDEVSSSATRPALARRSQDEGVLSHMPLSVPEGWLGGILYEVVERCDDADEWTAFTLRPAFGTTREGSTPVTRSSGDASGAHSTALNITLICHPLVTMEPDIRWCLRLIRQAQATATLLNANAKLSTLGGGYFLTRQTGHAIRLARAQSEVATALGDYHLAAKCRINEAYNHIWLGDYAKAKRIIQSQVELSQAAQDEELVNIATIAARFLRRSRKANVRLLQSRDSDVRRDHISNQHARGVRERIDVKTDEWHRVRALPSYLSATVADAKSQ